MSKLSIPNNIVDGTLIEASEHQQNYKQIESFVNDQVIHADGSVAMDAGAELLLGKNASVSLGAVTKAQLDNAVGSDVAGGGFLPLAGGTITGNLTVSGVLKAGGKEVYTKAQEGDQLYTKKEIDDLLAASKKEIDDELAARPLMKMCDKPTRIYDVRNPLKVLKWHKIQIPSTVGGVARSGAKAAYLNMTAINAPRQGWIAVRPDGSNWDPNNPSSIFSTMNLNPGVVENEHFLTEIGSNGAIQVWIHGLNTSDDGVNGLVVDVIALVF